MNLQHKCVLYLQIVQKNQIENYTMEIFLCYDLNNSLEHTH